LIFNDYKEWLKFPETKSALAMLEKHAEDTWWEHRASNKEIIEVCQGEVSGILEAVRKIRELGEDKE
jgi:hypothetical protein